MELLQPHPVTDGGHALFLIIFIGISLAEKCEIWRASCFIQQFSPCKTGVFNKLMSISQHIVRCLSISTSYFTDA